MRAKAFGASAWRSRKALVRAVENPPRDAQILDVPKIREPNARSEIPPDSQARLGHNHVKSPGSG